MVEAGRDVNIYNSVLNNVQGDSHHHHHSPNETGIHTLLQQIAHDAMHDSAAREPPPNCHADTRIEALDFIMAWIDRVDFRSRMFWLYGSAGVGKSAIMQAIAEALYGHTTPVAAAFFFGRGKGRREIGRYLFPTIAYQLAINIPGLREPVDQIMRNDPTLPSKSLKVQLDTLIINPLRSLSSQEPQPTPTRTLLIDGLDECQDDDMQRSILRLLGEAVWKHQLPLRFLIASRPEPQIRELFDTPTLCAITRRIALDKFNASKDIRKFLLKEFARISDSKSHLLIDVRQPWPGECVIDLLVHNSSGQFIYASTLIKFIDNKYARPDEQLEIVLDPKRRSSAFSDLDSLYNQILSTYPDQELLKRIIGTIIILEEPVAAIVIEDILGLRRGTVRLALQGLQSLLHGIEEDDKISIIHATLRDHLLDSKRSGTYFIDAQAAHAQLSCELFSHESDRILCLLQLHSAIPADGLRPLHGGARLYMFHHWKYHLRAGKQDAHDRVLAIAKEFQRACNPAEIHCDPVNAPLDEIYLILDTAGNENTQHDTFPYSLISEIYLPILRHCFESVFLTSGSVYDLFKVLPAYLALQGSSVRNTAGLFMVDEQVLRDMIARNRIFMDPGRQNYPFNTATRLGSTLDYSELPNFNRYICTFFRSDPHLQTPLNHFSNHRFNLVHHIFSCIFLPGRFDINSSFWAYLEHFFDCHPGFPGEAPDSEPGIKLLDFLKGIKYYHTDQKNAPPQVKQCIWTAVQRILRWLNNSQKTLESVRVMSTQGQGPATLPADFQTLFHGTCKQVLYMAQSMHEDLPNHTQVKNFVFFPFQISLCPFASTVGSVTPSLVEGRFLRSVHSHYIHDTRVDGDRHCLTWLSSARNVVYHVCCSGVIRTFSGYISPANVLRLRRI